MKPRADIAMACRGFSLVELVVTAAIAALVLTALVAALAGGIRVWERSRSLGRTQRELLLALEELERDLRNAFTCRGIAFEGREGSLTFPGLLRETSPDGASAWRLGSIRYAEDRGRRSLTRSTWAFPGGEPSGGREILVSSVVRMKFAYLGRTDSPAVNAWSSAWLGQTNRPAAVRIEVIVQRGGEHLETTRTIVLPCRS